jgi:hypothetical protein
MWAKHLEDRKTKHMAFAHSAAICGQRVQLTLDSGADHSVVAPRTLKKLKAAGVYDELNNLKVPHGERSAEGLALTKGGQIMVPKEATDFQLQMCIVVHSSAARHRGIAESKAAVLKVFW